MPLVNSEAASASREREFQEAQQDVVHVKPTANKSFQIGLLLEIGAKGGSVLSLQVH